ncbi:MAG: TetR/AcrR family transcriptional regulator [bacterium]|nr:TetR/AcrR family transcriptional regulator [bacterium]
MPNRYQLPPQEPDGANDSAKQRPINRIGRPRSTERHRKILGAALTLAGSNSYGNITIEMVAREACVAKTTIYRWWSSKASLIQEATLPTPLRTPNTGSLRGDLVHLLEQLNPRLPQQVSKHITLGLWADLISSPPDSQARELHSALIQHEKAVVEKVLMQAVKVGDLREFESADLTLSFLKGAPLHMRLALDIAPEQLSNEEIADSIISGLAR